jgi:hypothetical protein
MDRLAWNMKTLVEAYQQCGHTNPKWDESVKSALTEFARSHCGLAESNEDVGGIISNKCVTAVEAGCDDPMVRYLHIRFCMSQSESAKAFADAFSAVAQEMEKSSYPSIRKYYVWQRATQQFADTYGTNTPAEVNKLSPWKQAGMNLLAALSDRTMPPEEAYLACHENIEYWRWSKEHFPHILESIKAQWHADWKHYSPFLLLDGEAAIDLAWLARGGGYVDTVTRQGWKLFREHIAEAEEDLTAAWQLNTNDSRVAVKMMWVELGQGQGRDRMELWFRRALQVDSKNYDACSAKLLYIQPKWYGSVSDMLDFGRECVTNQQWAGHIPLIMVDAHVDIQSQHVSGWQKTNYWSDPAVWKDLKMAYDRFFKLNPSAIGWYHNYCWYAYQAQDWAALNTAIPKLGSINYNYFGGKEKFERMLAEAKEHAGDIKAKD